MKTLRIGTRQSKLALWQANFVQQQLQYHYPELTIDLVGITTEGDKIQDKSLADIGGKGLFIKAIEQALIENKIDIAVHSTKDIPPVLEAQFTLAAILTREDPRDAFVSNHFAALNDLPEGATIGTCSVRRQAQLLHYRPDLKIKSLRGNVDTRLAKLNAGDFDAIILAVAGLKRLNLSECITEYLPLDIMLPSVAQGAIGIECRVDDNVTRNLIKPLQNNDTAICVNTERALVQALNGNCHSPIGAYAEIIGEKIMLQGLVASIDGKEIVKYKKTSNINSSKNLGQMLAKELLHKGGKKILSC